MNGVLGASTDAVLFAAAILGLRQDGQ